MKAIVMAVAILVLTAQVGHAAPATPIQLPDWAISLMNRVPFLADFAAQFDDERVGAAQARSQESLSPEEKYRPAIARQSGQELEQEYQSVAKKPVAASTQRTPQRQ